MKSTGIIRRIDDLGRIVIPKEIRKNLKIKENEVLEVFIEDDKIILKKYSELDDMNNIIENFARALYELTSYNILITNRDKVIMCNENKKYEYINKEISIDFYNIITNRIPILSNDLKSIEIINNHSINANYYISPIINNGDVLGSIVLFSNKKIDEKSIMYTDMILKLIINYID